MMVCGALIATAAGVCGAGPVESLPHAPSAKTAANNNERFTMSVPFDDVGYPESGCSFQTLRAMDCPDAGMMLSDSGLHAETREAAARIPESGFTVPRRS
jgi:hypothetical protein